jgi:signal transduction histidine kinase/ActR/RegA family two-component response regulator
VDSLKNIIRTCGRIFADDCRFSGIEMLHQIVSRLPAELGFKYALVGRPKPTDDLVIETDVVIGDGEVMDNFAYNLEGTPCEEVLSGRRVCIYAKGVAELFPDDKILMQMGIECYAGSPILLPDGSLLGLVVILDERPLSYSEEILSTILEFVAARIAVELQRHQRNIEDRRRLMESVQSEKLKTIGQIAGGVAHDFNNLLGAIKGHTELLEMMISNPSCSDHTDAIMDSVKRGKEITSQLTDYARPIVKDSASCDVHHVIDEVVGLLSATMRGIRVDVNKLALRHIAAIHGYKFQQILVNLIINARDAMRQGQGVTITTKDMPQCDEILIEVADQGVGIAKENLGRIFDPYFTTKGVEGTGLGLASAYGLLKGVGGRIEVTSEPGVGTTFSIFVGVSQTIEDEDGPKLVDSTNDRIMVIDDEPHILSYLLARLAYDGFKAKGFSSIEEARNAFSPDDYDIVLSDLNFPGGTSKSFIEHINAIAPSVNVILMTGEVCHDDAVFLEAASLCRVLAKPFEYVQLLEMFKSEQSQLPNEPESRLS